MTPRDLFGLPSAANDNCETISVDIDLPRGMVRADDRVRPVPECLTRDIARDVAAERAGMRRARWLCYLTTGFACGVIALIAIEFVFGVLRGAGL